MLRSIFYTILLSFTTFFLSAQNCPDYSNTVNASGEACSQQPYLMSVENTDCSGEIYFQVNGSIGFWGGSIEIVSILSGQTVAYGSTGLGGGTVNWTVGPIDPNIHGSIFDLIIDNGNMTISQNGNTIVQHGSGHVIFSVGITISSATMTVQTPSGNVTQTVQSCKDFFLNVELENTNFCTPINVNLPWTITCDVTGAILSSGTHTVTVNPDIPTDATDVVDITWNSTTCSWDVSANNDCDLLDIGTIFTISPEPSSLDYDCLSGNETFTIDYLGLPNSPDCCSKAGPLTPATYNYTSSNPVATSSPYGGVNNAGHINIPPYSFGGNATNLQLCVDVSNLCYNPIDPADATWYISIFVDNVEVYFELGQSSNSGNICVNLNDLPSGYNQASNIDVYVFPNTFGLTDGSLNTTFLPNGNCGSLTTGQWTADITATLDVTFTDQEGSPVDCSNFTLTAPYTACGVAITPNVNVLPATCNAAGSATVTNYDNTYSYTFDPSDGASVDASGNIVGFTFGQTYTVTAVDGNCEATSSSFTIEDQLTTPDAPTVNLVGATCDADGSASINNYDNTLTYTFSPAGPSIDGSGNITGADTGVAYTVTASNGDCDDNATFTIEEQLEAPATPNVILVGATCDADGSASINNYDNALTYTFSPAGPAVDGSGNITGADAGVAYTVTASNGDCDDNATFTIEEQLEAPELPIIDIDPATCDNLDGYAIITNYDPSYNYTFNPSTIFFPTVNSQGEIEGATPGANYTIFVSNGDGCSISMPFSIPNNIDVLDDPVVTTTAPTCDDAGSSSIDNYNGVLTYTFDPVGPSVDANGNIVDADPSVTYTVTASNGDCESDPVSFINANKLPSPIITATASPSTICAGESSVLDANVLAGANTTTEWDNGLGSGGPHTVSPTVTTVYTVTATSPNGCFSTETVTVTVNEAPEVTISTTPATCAADGSASITDYDNALTYTFTPAGPSVDATGNIVDADPGVTYTIEVSNGDCDATETFTIDEQLDAPDVPTVTLTAATCNADGSAIIDNYDNTLTYTFTPAGPSVDATGNIVAADAGVTYTVTASDGDCDESTTFTIEEQLETVEAPQITTFPATCDVDGNSIIDNYDANANYVFSPAGPSVDASGNIIDADAEVEYTVYVEGNECDSPSVTFTNEAQKPAPDSPVVITEEPTCSADGYSYVDNYDPSLTYSFNPVGPSVDASGNIIDADMGMSYLIIASNGECTGVSFFMNEEQLDAPDVPTVTLTAATCSADGSATIDNYDNTLTYTFSPAGPAVDATGNITADAGVTYTVTASNGDCDESATFTIEEQLDAPDMPTVTLTAATCDADGSATIDNYDNTLTYTFNPAGPSVDATGNIVDADAGTTYTVTASNGDCDESATFTIEEQLDAPATPNVILDAATCAADGSATINNYDSALTYTFSPAGPSVDASGNIVDADAGVTYTVTASNGDCDESATFTIEEQLDAPDMPTVTLTAATCGADGSATIDNYDNTLTYTFSPAGPSVDATGNIVDADAGVTYTVTASDGDCDESATFTLEEQLDAPDMPTVTLTAATCSADGSATIDNYDNTLTYTFSPAGPAVDATGNITADAGVTYTVTASNGDCDESATFTIDEQLDAPDTPTVSLTAATCEADGSASIGNYETTLTYTFSPAGPAVDATGNIVDADAGVDYTVTVSNGDCDESATFTIEEQLEAPTVTVSADDEEICIGESTTVTAAGDNNTTYDWDNGLGAGETHTVTPTVTTTYTVTATNEDGCSTTESITVEVNPLPTITIDAPQTIICSGEEVTFTSSGADSYDWDNGLGSGATQTVSPTETTTYTVTGTSTSGCVNTAHVTVTVKASPDVVADAIDKSICEGDSMVIYASGALTYDWDNGLGAGITHTVSPTTTTTYTVIGTAVNGCQSTDMITITVLDLPVVSAGEDQEVCIGGEVEISASGADTYYWHNGIGSGATHTVAPSTTTTYSVTGTSQEGCVDQDSVTVIVHDLPIIDIDEEFTACAGSSVTMSVTEHNSDYDYNWYFNEAYMGTGFSYDINPVELSHGGVYTIVAENDNGCVSEIETTLNVEVCDIVISQAFTPNDDGFNDYFYIQYLEAYPNTEVWIYNRWGAEVYHTEDYLNNWDGTSQNALNVGGEELPEGTYYYVIKLGGTEGQVNAGEHYKGFVYLKR